MEKQLQDQNLSLLFSVVKGSSIKFVARTNRTQNGK